MSEQVKYDFLRLEEELAKLYVEAVALQRILKLSKKELKEKIAGIRENIELLEKVRKYSRWYGEEATIKWINGAPLPKKK